MRLFDRKLVISLHHISWSRWLQHTHSCTLPAITIKSYRLWAPDHALCVCVFSYCTCVVQRHVTAWFLSLWNFSLGAVRRDWGGAVCDPCFIIRLVTGYSAWWAVTDTWHSQSLLAARQSRQVVDSSKGGPGWATSPQKSRILLKRFMKLHIQVENSGKFAHQRREFIVEGKHFI